MFLFYGGILFFVLAFFSLIIIFVEISDRSDKKKMQELIEQAESESNRRQAEKQRQIDEEKRRFEKLLTRCSDLNQQQQNAFLASFWNYHSEEADAILQSAENEIAKAKEYYYLSSLSEEKFNTANRILDSAYWLIRSAEDIYYDLLTDKQMAVCNIHSDTFSCLYSPEMIDVDIPEKYAGYMDEADKLLNDAWALLMDYENTATDENRLQQYAKACDMIWDAETKIDLIRDFIMTHNTNY